MKKNTRFNYDSRLRPMLVKDIIYDSTDNDHWITSNEILNILEDIYGLKVTRQTLYTDIEKLIDAGYDIVTERDIQNKYKVASRDFDIAELKMIIDNIEASKSLSYSRSLSLAKKIAALAGPCAADYLLSTIDIDARKKTENNQVCYIVETVYDAISKHRKIKFAYYEYLADKTRVTKHNGEQYIISPYKLAMSGDFYYLIGLSDKHNKIVTFRVDRISGVPIMLPQEAAPIPDGFAVSDYLKDSFRTFSSEKIEVSLLFNSMLMDNIVDRFGESLNITGIDGDMCKCTVKTSLSNAFFAWVFGAAGKVRILDPMKAKEDYVRMVSKEMARL
ncbi:MAG: transcriptional regulator [Saccharofermentans sp.]|nr:transcriptional regulator [Saccharofermentans sp.]